MHLADFFLHSHVLLLDLLQLRVLLSANLVVPLELVRKRGDLLLPYAQVLIQSLQLELLIFTVGRFFDGVALHIVLLFQAFDRLFKSHLQVNLCLELRLPADRDALLISGPLRSEPFQLLLQLLYHVLVHFNLLLAILNLFLTNSQHVVRIEVWISICSCCLSDNLGRLSLEGALHHAVQVLDTIPQLQVDLLQALNVVINDALLLIRGGVLCTTIFTLLVYPASDIILTVYRLIVVLLILHNSHNNGVRLDTIQLVDDGRLRIESICCSLTCISCCYCS